jgi:crotonobetainyl-CoA:carnitine CoA-transferase CaiB-like acyl-CoA transferase
VSALTAAEVAAEVWQGLGGDPQCLDRLTVTGPAHVLPSVFPVTAVAAGTIAAATLAAAELWRARGGPTSPVAVDTRHAAFACRSEQFVETLDHDLGGLWDPVSGVYAASDGWIRLHTNFRRHRNAALKVLGLPTSESERALLGRDQVASAVARWRALGLEEAVHRDGGCTAVLRSAPQWRATPQARALAARPRVALMPLGGEDGEVRRGPGGGDGAAADPPARPLAGLRVVDLTRVIAGPVAGRLLAAYGADVVRVDGPDAEDSARLIADTTVGKRSAVLDLQDTGVDRGRFERLVAGADVVLCGYRPGALDALGYGPEELAKRRPGVVVGELSAYGGVGPWGQRRGFDSLVQMVSGIADEGRRAAGVDTPRPLPAQLLDHATGYLLAAGVLAGLARRRAAGRGGGWLVQVSLARTAGWIDALPRAGAADIEDGARELPVELGVDLDGPLGRSRHVACPGLIVGAAPAWPTGPVPLGHDAPTWE